MKEKNWIFYEFIDLFFSYYIKLFEKKNLKIKISKGK
tara:strand:+ start:99 stop:209 length:111 start_codon:yes stop_codon:yes gene_type:complete